MHPKPRFFALASSRIMSSCSLGLYWINNDTYFSSETRMDTWERSMTLAAGPVEKLVKLIADEKRVDEKIRDTQAALTLVKKRVSESLAQHYIASPREPRFQMPEDLMREEQSYERLLQALQDMKNEIAKKIRPVEEQIIQANVDHLRQTFSQESRRLTKCLEEIDD